MFVSMLRSLRPTFLYDADDGSASGGEPVGGEPVGDGGEPVVEGAPPEGAEPVVVDWAKRVQEEWGGEESVKNAVELQKALQTREGVQALFFEAGRALGFGDEKIQSLWQQQQSGGSSAAQESIEDLLSDPERVLTAGELRRVLEHERTQQRQEQTATNHQQAIGNAVEAATTELGLDADAKRLVLALADKYVPDVTKATPDQVRSAMTRAYDDLKGVLTKTAGEYVAEKREQKTKTPSTPKGGSSSGGEAAPEPQNLKEAMARVRKSMEGATAS